jgi:hypothetical protein
MKALTICQPYPHLICMPETDPRHKRVENREWPTKYRGPLVIHAGKSKFYLDDERSYRDAGLEANYGIPITDMVFGAAVSICNLTDCIHIDEIEASGRWDTKYPWLRDHLHASGPWCFILQDVRPVPKPIPYRGAQGFWNFPDHLLRDAGVLPAKELHENGDGV